MLHVNDLDVTLEVEGRLAAGECFDPDLHAATQQHLHLERRARGHALGRQRAAVGEPLAAEREALRLGGDTLLLVQSALHIAHCIRRVHVQRNRLWG